MGAIHFATERGSFSTHHNRFKMDSVDVDTAKKVQELSKPFDKEKVASRKLEFSTLNSYLLYSEILKLLIEGEYEEARARLQEQMSQDAHSAEIIKNLESTANWLFTTALIGGGANFLAPVISIGGSTELGAIAANAASNAFNLPKNLGPVALAEKLSKMVSAVGQMQPQAGESQKQHAEAARNKHQLLSERAKTDADESTTRRHHISEEQRALKQLAQENMQRETENSNTAFSR